MKILITGATANQTNPISHSRSPNFAGLMRDTLISEGHDVTWARPDEIESTDEFEKVVIGLASPLSMGSNYIYAAMRHIGSLWNCSKLALYVDAPDPNNITRALDSLEERPESLFKPFFAARKEYHDANRNLLEEVCRTLSHSDWPTTIVPCLPWTNSEKISGALPNTAVKNLNLINLDHHLFNRFEDRPDRTYPYSHHVWTVERGHNPQWLERLALALPVDELASDHRREVYQTNIDKLRTTIGFLHNPYRRDKTWWTPHIAMALSQGAAVFTNWRESKILGEEWNVLPGTFETFASSDQNAVASAQYDSYRNVFVGQETLTNILGL